MSLLNLFKLEKLRIEAYLDAERKKKADPAKMDMMFNPATYKRSRRVVHSRQNRQGINQQGRSASYNFTSPGELSLQLVLDGTGVNLYGAERLLKPPSVKKDIETFEKLCVLMNGDIHQPHFLVVRWGSFSFPGRLSKLDINYTLFDESGDPLRAELDVEFVEDSEDVKAQLVAGKNSPDLTHVRIAKAGDTLPLMCHAIYGSSRHYLRVAQHNGLDDFRRLQPGQRILFPPLDDEGLRAGGGDAA